MTNIEKYLTYCYSGANCFKISFKKSVGDLITISNDYGDVMFRGYQYSVFRFIQDLKEDKLA